MNRSEPLKTLSQTDLDAIVRYSSLLSNVYNKVSRQNPTSTHPLNALGRGLFDKLEIYLPRKQYVNEIIEHCHKLGFKVEGKYKRDKKYYLVIDTGTLNINCLLGIPNNQGFYKVIVNPSHAERFSEIEGILIRLFGPTVLYSKVYRIDCTVDVNQGYETVLRGLDVKFKKVNHEYMGGSIRTGLIVGSGDDKVIIYNKAKKERVNQPWTRIERQMRGPKAPIKEFSKLRDGLLEILDFDPMKIVTLNNLEFIESPNLTKIQKEQYSEFKALIKHLGYFLTRKKLNENKNFQRDYGKYFTLTPYQYQPSDIFNEDIKNFFMEVVQ